MTLHKYLKNLNTLETKLNNYSTKLNIVTNKSYNEVLKNIYNDDMFQYMIDITNNKLPDTEILYNKLIRHYIYKVNTIETKIKDLKNNYFKS